MSDEPTIMPAAPAAGGAGLADELFYLRDLSQAISEGASLDWLFNRVVEIVANALRVDIVSLMLIEHDGDGGKDFLHIMAARGLAEEIVRKSRVELGHHISGLVAATGEALLLADVEQAGLGVPSSNPRYRDKALLSAPIRARARIIGVLNVNNKTAGRLDERDLALLTTLCNQAGMAIDNARLFDEVRRRAVELAAVNRELDRVSRAKSELIINLSHEIKTPLTAIQGYVDLLKSGLIAPQKTMEVLIKVHDRTRHLNRLAERLIAFFALDSGLAKFHRQPFALDSMIADCAQELASRAATKEVTFEIDRASLQRTALADAAHYREAIGSLLDNAVKFNVRGGSVRVYATPRDLGGRPGLEIFFQDAGPGIPEELKEVIFEEFKQTDDIMVAKPDGLGLGLAIARAVCEAHSCHLQLIKTGPDGSLFGMTIPLDPDSPAG